MISAIPVAIAVAVPVGLILREYQCTAVRHRDVVILRCTHGIPPRSLLSFNRLLPGHRREGPRHQNGTEHLTLEYTHHLDPYQLQQRQKCDDDEQSMALSFKHRQERD